jgi:hypothetical protein
MKGKALLFMVCLVALAGNLLQAVEPTGKGEVTLAVRADRHQPSGWPIVVDVTVTNTGKDPISWWCGGPDTYPGAEHFTVEVRYGPDTVWHKASASNGQYVLGSGIDRRLAPGAFVVVPLAIPIDLPDSGNDLEKQDGNMGGVTLRVSTREWLAANPVETYVTVWSSRQYVDERRQRVIQAVFSGKQPFWKHLAERYPDPVVLDTMLKLATVDCQPLAGGAASILARQPVLPESDGDALGSAARRWVPLSPRPEWGGLREDIVSAALKTKAEVARQTVLDLLRASTDAQTKWLLINALRLSPGDKKWLSRARADILASQEASPGDQELARQVKLATQWLESRLKNDE